MIEDSETAPPPSGGEGPDETATRVASSSPRYPHGRNRKLAVGVRIALVVGLLLVSGLVFAVLRATKEQSGVRSEPVPPLTVRAIEATPRPVDRVWEGFGTVRSMNRAEVAAEVSGRVVERPEDAEPGRAIARGALLLAIDPTDTRIGVARAEQALAGTRAQLDGLLIESERVGNQLRFLGEEVEAARRDLDRTRRAVESGAGSQGELDARTTAVLRASRELDALSQLADLIPSRRAALEAQLAAQQAELDQAGENLARTRITSPIGGEIQELTLREGDYVNAGTTVGVVVDLSRVEIPLRLPASSASWVTRAVGVEGAASLWSGAAVGEPSHLGTVTRLAPEADPASRTITVFVEVLQDPDRNDRLLPGSFVHGRVRTPDPADRVVLPRRAVRAGRVMLVDRDEDGVRRVRPFVVSTDYAIQARFPEVDPNETEWVVLGSDSRIPPGSSVAVSAVEQLEPGSVVLLQGERAATPGGEP